MKLNNFLKMSVCEKDVHRKEGAQRVKEIQRVIERDIGIGMEAKRARTQKTVC